MLTFQSAEHYFDSFHVIFPQRFPFYEGDILFPEIDRRKLILDSLLCYYSLFVRMFYLFDFRDQIRELEKFLGGVAAGED